jgi:hypothetical protein
MTETELHEAAEREAQAMDWGERRPVVTIEQLPPRHFGI